MATRTELNRLLQYAQFALIHEQEMELLDTIRGHVKKLYHQRDELLAVCKRVAFLLPTDLGDTDLWGMLEEVRESQTEFDDLYTALVEMSAAIAKAEKTNG